MPIRAHLILCLDSFGVICARSSLLLPLRGKVFCFLAIFEVIVEITFWDHRELEYDDKFQINSSGVASTDLTCEIIGFLGGYETKNATVTPFTYVLLLFLSEVLDAHVLLQELSPDCGA